MEVTYQLVEEEEFPNGIRCRTCLRHIPPGRPYSEKLDGFDDDGESLIVELFCVYC
jgi:hypothetical protein